MNKVLLNGEWDIKSQNGKFELKGDIPGTDFGNLIKKGLIVNPLISGIEQEALDTAENDFIFEREFDIKKDILNAKNVALRCECVDTLCDVYVNGTLVATLNNAYIPLDVDVKAQLKEGKNTIKFDFKSAYKYIRDRQAKDPLPANFNGVNGIPYIRKPGCHFGWDWGPCVPYCGILDDIYLKAYDEEISNITIKQDTTKELAKLEISADGAKEIYILDPDGKKIALKDGKAEIKNPKLWWTRELSEKEEQPLYSVVFKNDEEEIVKKIGLRHLVLSQAKDEYGTDFSLMINGERVFAKGGNMIPFAAIFEDITKDMIDYYINLAVKSNFNIIRIWGGGSYASEYILSECDKLGILVWQDLCFACQMYPFYEKDFLDNVVNEIKYNVKRMSLHPSTAIFAGNNEIETIYSWMPSGTKLMSSYREFFYDIVPQAIDGLTDVSYIPTSPLGSEFKKNISSDNYGDTHMWNVWHGLKKLDYYQLRFSRFLSEFGLESLPSNKAINTFCSKEEDFDITSAAFNAHQKCIGGNKKMLFYLTEMFDFPKKFEALPYLTGIVQAECIKNAAVHFRQNKGRCNGAIYWQYNDVWNCPSWASVDFERVPKALQYKAKEFFAPVTVTCKKQDGRAYIFAHNDTLTKKHFDIKIEEVKIKDGSIVNTWDYKLDVEGNSFDKIAELQPSKSSILKISYNGEAIYEILDKASKLPLNKVEFETTKEGKTFTIKANNVAYDVCVESDAIADDNYFSLLKGEQKTITFDKEPSYINIVCANNIEFDKNKLRKFFFRFFYRLEPLNVANFIYYSKT